MPTGGDAASEISNRLEPMNTLAADTNGKVIFDASTHLDEALDTLGAAELDYYIIGFAAPAAALADRSDYRHVSVRVTRPGARVSTRTGYVAGPAQTPADRRRAIDAALRRRSASRACASNTRPTSASRITLDCRASR